MPHEFLKKIRGLSQKHRTAPFYIAIAIGEPTPLMRTASRNR